MNTLRFDLLFPPFQSFKKGIIATISGEVRKLIIYDTFTIVSLQARIYDKSSPPNLISTIGGLEVLGKYVNFQIDTSTLNLGSYTLEIEVNLNNGDKLIKCVTMDVRDSCG